MGRRIIFNKILWNYDKLDIIASTKKKYFK